MQQKTASGNPDGWNIFARELKRILNRYGLDWIYLMDRVGIHPEKVRRLTRSLDTPQNLPALNTQEMKMLTDSLSLEMQDVLRLRAALLTNALQRTFTLYISSEDIPLAAESLFLTILQYLKDHTGTEALSDVRGGDIQASEDTELDSLLASALDAFDSGTEELQMSYLIPSRKECVKKALQARASFSTAIELLRHLSIDIQWQASWQYWYGEARKGLLSVTQRLDELGE